LLLLLTPDLATSLVLLLLGACLFMASDLAVDLEALFSFEVVPGGMLFFRTVDTVNKYLSSLN
jgi:cell division protein FtsW (lipid II flippase)